MGIMDAINSGDIDRVKELLDSGVDPNIVEENGYTALTLASLYGCAEIVRLLVDSKADPNIQDKWGSTALNLAAGLNNLSTVKILLDYDDTNIRDDSGKTALMIAEKKGYDGIAKLIKDTIVSRENAKKMVRNKQVLSMSKGLNDKNSTVQNLDSDVFRKVMDYVEEPSKAVLQSETQRPQQAPDTAREERWLTLKKRLNHVKNQPKGGKRNIKKRNSKKLTNKKGGKRSKHKKRRSKRSKRNNKKGGKHKKRSNKRNNKK